MNLLRLYIRTLRLLGSEARLGWALALANVLLAAAQFAEPVLFGRIIDALAGAQTKNVAPDWTDLGPLLGAWVGFGLFTILAGAWIALNADRLSHRRRHAVLTNYFEHVLQLPLSYHGGTHSGRLTKIMITGTDSLWWLWLGFFREHLAALVSLIVLLPLSLFLNWRLAMLLIILCVVFTALTALVVHKAQSGQTAVERHYSDLAERTSDALGNVALVQSYSRIEDEVVGVRNVVAKLLGAQMPVLSWWALTAVLTRASTTLTMLAIFIVGIGLYMKGLTTIGEIVTFTSFAGLLVQRLEQAVGFVNRIFMDAPRLIEFFDVLDTVPAVRDQPPRSIRAGSAAWSNSRTCRFPMTASGPRSPTSTSPRCRARRLRWSGRPARASRPRSRCCIACSIRNRAASRSTEWISARSSSRRSAATSAWCSRRCCC